jgi:GAF domain-containing protein
MLLNADQAFILQRYSDCLCIHKARWMRDSRRLCPGIGHICNASDYNSSLSKLNRMLVINDTRDEKLSPCSQDLHRSGIFALLAVPIYRDTQFFGLLCLAQMENPRIWTTAEISMVRTTADTIMSAYLRTRMESGLHENVRILTEYDEALQDLLAQKETLAGISGNFLHAGVDGLNECASAALGDIGRLLDLDGLRAVLYSKEELEIFAWQESGLPARIGSEYGRLSEMALHAASSGTPVSIDDTAAENKLPELARAAAEEGLRSLFIVPLCNDETMIGALMGYKVIGIKSWTLADISSCEDFARIFADAYRQRLQRFCQDAAWDG